MEKIVDSRILFIDGEINDELANHLIIELLYLDSINHEDINLYINSPGGEITSGLAIIDTMNTIKSNVNTVCISSCYSMAAVILLCGNKGKRAILPNAEVMIHEVSVNNLKGKAKSVLAMTKRMESKNELILDIISKNTNIKLNKLKELISEDYFMNAKEALDKGFVDVIL